MKSLQQKQVEDAIAHYRDPYLGMSLADMGAIAGIDINDVRLRLAIELGYAAAGNEAETRERLQRLLEPIAGGRRIVIDFACNVLAHKAQQKIPFVGGVRNIVAVASGKGGVGKSTTAVNLALALEREGARVGLLDADIYGPSQGMMLGVAVGQRPEVRDEKHFVPIKAHGIVAMSMSFLVDEQTPMVWRGPMVSSALQQMLMQTDWGELDYLVIDMPPGTGDIQLTLAQRVPVSGAVIVTTPQNIALQDAVKGIEMFRKVDIPVLGVVENMSVHICSRCGHAEHLFGEGGGERVAQRYDTVLLGAMPLSVHIREQTDSGTPTVVAEPDGAVTALYRGIARHVGARLALQALQTRTSGPVISIEDC